MAQRTGYAGTQAPGDILTSANFTKMPNGIVAYASITSGTSGIGATTTDITGLTLGSFTFPASRIYQIYVHIGYILQNTSAGQVKVYVRDSGSATIGTVFYGQVGAANRASVDGSIYLTPSAGAETYKVSASTSAGTCDVTANGQPGDPGRGFILLIDHGPIF